MKFTHAIAACLMVPGICLGIKVELPEWSTPKDAAEYSLGGGLWPSGLIPDSDDTNAAGKKVAGVELMFGPPAPAKNLKKNTQETGRDGSRASLATNEAIGATDGETAGAESEEEVVETLPPIEGRLRDQYFALAPVDFLLDPQRLLTEQKSNDLRRFLEFHSDESKFHIFVLVLGETQEIPKDISLEKLHGEWFGENPSVLMVYHRERPEMTQLVYNASVRAAFEKSVFDRIMQNCLREGAATENAPDQVEKMAVELSIQLYWMTRLLERQMSQKESEAAGTAVAEARSAATGAPTVLREDAPSLFPEVAGATAWVQQAAKWGILLAIGLGAGFLSWCVMWFWRRDGAAGKPLLFPDVDTVPRLGGEFSGGGFVGMSYEIGDGDGRFD